MDSSGCVILAERVGFGEGRISFPPTPSYDSASTRAGLSRMTKNSSTQSTNISTSFIVLAAPKLTRTISAGLPFPAHPSPSLTPHLAPAEKSRRISHGARPRAAETPPGLQTPPVRRLISRMAASFSISACWTNDPVGVLKLSASIGP